MKLLNALLIASALTLTLSACLKDKNAEEAPAPEQTMEEQQPEMPAADATEAEVPEAVDSGTTQTN